MLSHIFCRLFYKLRKNEIQCQNFDRSTWNFENNIGNTSVAAVNEIILVFPQSYCYGSSCQFKYHQCRSYRDSSLSLSSRFIDLFLRCESAHSSLAF